MKYCNHCGNPIPDEARFCSKCGKEAHRLYGKNESNSNFTASEEQDYKQEENTAPSRGGANNSAQLEKHRELVKTLSSRLRMNGIIWFIIAGIQIIIGACGTIVPLIVGVLNIISAINDLKLSKQVLVDQGGIVKSCEPMTSTIVTLVYNAVVGAVIGIGGSMYYMFAIRKFVLDNKEAFLEMEENSVTV